MNKLKRVLIMAGGTGGHVFPGLAVAKCMQEHGVEVHWMGTSQGLESRLVPEANIPLHLIKIQGLRGKGVKSLLMAPLKISTAVMQAARIIKKINPDLVIGMGGFVSGPGGIASWMSRRPLVIHEQNALAGYTNKRLSAFAARVLEGFPSAFKPSKKVIVVGNPVRQEIERIEDPAKRLLSPRNKLRLFIVGGSLGAQALNEILPRVMAQIAPEDRPEIYHQTGEKFFAETKKIYESNNIEANVQPFVKDMAQVYEWADLVICRAGALTVAELCAAGVGAIFVPYPHAVDDHQTANANFMAEHNAALVIQQSQLTDERLADIVRQFSKAPEKRLAMAQAAYSLRKINVAEKIYKICEEVCL